MSLKHYALLVSSAFLCAAASAQTPVKLWDYPMPAPTLGGHPMWNAPAIGADGVVYYGWGPSVYAINTNGTTRWSFNSGGFQVSSPALSSDGTINFCCASNISIQNAIGTLCALTPDGTPLSRGGVTGHQGTALQQIAVGEYNNYLGDNINGPSGTGGGFQFNVFITVGLDGSVYYAETSPCCDEQNIYAISANGRRKWDTYMDVNLGLPVIGADGNLYVGEPDQKCIDKFSSDTGALLASYYTGAINASPVIDASNTIYIGSTSGMMYAYGGGWQFNATNSINYAAALGANGMIYFGAGSNLFALNAQNGNEQWQLTLPDLVMSSPILSGDGVLYIGTWSGLTAVNVFTGPANGPWPMWGRDLRNSCRVTPFDGTHIAIDYMRAISNGLEMVAFGPVNNAHIEASTDLQNWTTMTNIGSANGTLYVHDVNPGLNQRFYKVSSP